MSRSNSGRGRLRLLIDLAILAAIVFIAIQTVPVYVQNYQLTDHIRQLAIQATAEHATAESVRSNVLAYARELSIPIRRENVKVGTGNNKVTIRINYSVPVDLKAFTWVLHFAPTAENQAL
jgi:uncharacterized protein (UPF0333 family)